ncbi:hypothetical protein OsI_36048 [Oryza sativa Indica Group]|uniref:XS domain-containing protein n=1 Tax=Oryza sativa subsp. indica TaxID=39946 RepID=B8BKE7_ORYSI|nr:hypothetical protein OsI_36048 [Oryza sativa Indica Group]
MRPPAALLPMPAPKRKWEGQANGSIPGESSGRQQQQKPEEKRVAKQVKVETPDVDAKQLKSSFLKMVKLMNENAEQKKNYRANGKISQLKCTVCGRGFCLFCGGFFLGPGADILCTRVSNSGCHGCGTDCHHPTEEQVGKEAGGISVGGGGLGCAMRAEVTRDSIDLHSLLNHSYYAKSAELRADHLGLHKALCVLMGWNYSVDPVHKKAYQTLSTADAEANQGDLILWPPTVIIENTYKSKNDGQKDGMSNKEMEGKLREMGFVGASVKPLSGKDGQRSMLVKFASSLAGLSEAERLAQSLEKQGHGRAEWYRVRSVPPGADGGSNPLLVKVGVKGERTWVLYGYLATAWDLDALDLESKQNAVIKSRKELDLSE